MTRRVMVVGWAALLVAPMGTTRGQEATPAPAPGRVVFADEFEGPSLRRESWNVEVTSRPANNEQQDYINNDEVIAFVRGDAAAGAEDGAALLIRAVHDPLPAGTAPGTVRRVHDFVSARLNTRGKVEFTHGTAAARMKLPAGTGLWPAFWLLGDGRWPATGEIDVMECIGDASWTNCAVHGPGYSGNTPFLARYPFPEGQDATGWHVYSVDWSPEAIAFAVDGHEYYRVTRAEVEAKGRWPFDEPKFLIVNLALGGAYPQGVNGAKEPYPGLPAETVERIKAGGAKVLVDWVRVTAR